MVEIRDATFIVQVSGECNLGCRYCYYFSKTQRKSPALLKIELLEKFLSQAAEIFPRVDLIWHGGEPLLAGIETFRNIVAMQEEIKKRSSVKFQNRLQTNCTLINQEWATFFKEYDFGIGVSLDGPDWIHNANRVYLSGKGSFDETRCGIDYLQKAGIKFGLLSVVTSHSLDHSQEIYEYFLREGFKKFEFLPCVDYIREQGTVELSSISLREGDFARFMIEVFDKWFFQDDPSISIRYLKNALIGLLGGQPSICKLNRTCHQFFTVGYDGVIGPCDNFGGCEDFVYGDIHRDFLLDIFKSQSYRRFCSSVLELRQECKSCKYQKVCGGGCSWHSYFQNQGFGKNMFCEDSYRIFEHISNRLNEYHPDLSTILKEGA